MLKYNYPTPKFNASEKLIRLIYNNNYYVSGWFKETKSGDWVVEVYNKDKGIIEWI